MLFLWYMLSIVAQGGLFSMVPWEPGLLWIVPLAIWYAAGLIAAPTLLAIEILRTSSRIKENLLADKFAVFIAANAPLVIAFVISTWALTSGAWEGTVYEWLICLAALAFLPTWFMTPIACAILLSRLRGQWKIIASVTLIAIGMVGIGGWVWAATADNGTRSFTGQERAYAESAWSWAGDLCFTKGEWTDFVQVFDQYRWRVTDVQSFESGRYVARIQFLSWMRRPTFVASIYVSNKTVNCVY